MKKSTAEAKKCLKQIKIISCSIMHKMEELKELRATAESISAARYDNDRVTSSRKSSDALFVDNILHLDALEKKIESEIMYLSEKKHRILSCILCMENENQSQLLIMHYLEYKSFEEISAITGYSYQYTINLHRQALTAFGEIYEKTDNILVDKSA